MYYSSKAQFIKTNIFPWVYISSWLTILQKHIIKVISIRLTFQSRFNCWFMWLGRHVSRVGQSICVGLRSQTEENIRKRWRCHFPQYKIIIETLNITINQISHFKCHVLCYDSFSFSVMVGSFLRKPQKKVSSVATEKIGGDGEYDPTYVLQKIIMMCLDKVISIFTDIIKW